MKLCIYIRSDQIRSVAQSCPILITALQVSLSITNSQNLLKLMSIESGVPSSHLILCRPFLFLPSIFPSIRIFSNESAFHIRWPKYWSFSFSISPSNEYSGLNSFRASLVAQWKESACPHSSTLAGNSHGRRSLVGSSPWGRKESGMTE